MTKGENAPRLWSGLLITDKNGATLISWIHETVLFKYDLPSPLPSANYRNESN